MRAIKVVNVRQMFDYIVIFRDFPFSCWINFEDLAGLHIGGGSSLQIYKFP